MYVCVGERGDVQGGEICTKAGVPDDYGEQVAAEDKVRKKWRGRAADGVREEEQQSFRDVCCRFTAAPRERSHRFHKANRARTKSGGDATTGRKVSE